MNTVSSTGDDRTSYRDEERHFREAYDELQDKLTESIRTIRALIERASSAEKSRADLLAENERLRARIAKLEAIVESIDAADAFETPETRWLPTAFRMAIRAAIAGRKG